MLQRVDRTGAAQADGVVIVIDTIRAFPIAGYAFDGGAKESWPARTIEEARTLRKRQPDVHLSAKLYVEVKRVDL